MRHFNKHLNNVVTYLPISDTLLKCVSFVFDVACGKAGLTLTLGSCMWLTLNLCWAELCYTCSFQSWRQLGAARQAHNGSLECHELTAIIDPGTECSRDRELSLSSVQGRIREVTYARSPREQGLVNERTGGTGGISQN